MFEDVKNVLYADSAVAGEAAGISMGLLMAGTASDKAQEMLSYAHDTQHEKIIRGGSHLGVVLGHGAWNGIAFDAGPGAQHAARADHQWWGAGTSTRARVGVGVGRLRT